MPPPKAEERVVPVPAGQALVPSSGETPVSGVQNAQSEPIQKLSRAETDGLHKKERVKVCRVDQIYDRKSRKTIFVKTKDKEKKEKWSRYVLVVRRIISLKGVPVGLEIDILGPHLFKILAEIHVGHEEVNFNKSPPDISAKTMFFSRKQLQQKLLDATQAETPDKDIIFEIMAGLDFINEQYKDTIADLETMLPVGEMSYDHLWTIFSPRTILYIEDSLRNPRLYILKEADYYENNISGEKFYFIRTISVDFDGSRLGLVTGQTFIIDPFQGAQKIVDLPIFPLDWHPESHRVRKEVLARGHARLRLHGRHLQEYAASGYIFREVLEKKIPQTRRDQLNRHMPETKGHYFRGRVLIDHATMRKMQPSNELNPNIYAELNASQLTDDQILALSSVVYGFGLQDKLWGAFAISSLEDVRWDDRIWESLVMPDAEKDFIRTLIDAHRSRGTGFDDIVRNKGKGLIGLLAGPPGVGKTLTAEAVAEITRRPLYTLSSGELGATPQDVGKNLSSILELSEMWDAVLLLDEADVFLAKRETTSLSRNAITAIFLRQLEYFEGILFLTTNRLNTFDHAFQSRIHFCLEYSSLDTASRVAIWNTFLSRATDRKDLTVAISEEGVRSLAEEQLNGRQIKNIMAMSQTVAKQRNEPLTVASVRTAIRLSQNFPDNNDSQVNGLLEL